MTELFQNYDDEISRHCRRIQEVITQFEIQDSKSQALTEISNCIQESEENLKQMEIEMESYDAHMKQNLKQQFQMQKYKVEELKKIYNNLKNNTEYAKEQLFGSEKAKQQLLREQKEQDKIFNQNAKLEDAKLVAYGIEKEANDIQLNLHKNNQVMIRNIDKSRSIRDELGGSYALIKTMKDRIKKNRMVLYGVAGMLLFALLIIFFWR